MKTLLLILLLPFACLAQHPLVTGAGIDWTRATSPLANYTNNLYLEYEADLSSSLTNYGDGNSATFWTNIAPITAAVSSANLHAFDSAYPLYRTNATPTGTPALDWVNNVNGSPDHRMATGASWSNQPNTILIVAKPITSVQGFIFDCSTGGRTITVASLTNAECYAGVFLNQNYATNTSWVLYTFVLNGTSSYIRTNGVFATSGNTSTAGVGNLAMGNDNSLVSKWVGKIASMRFYNEAMSTNNLHTAEQNLATRYLGITLPSP